MEKSKNKMLLIILGVIAVIVIVALAVYFLVIRGKNKVHYSFAEFDKKCETQIDMPDEGYSAKMISYMQVEDDRIMAMRNVREFHFTTKEAYDKMLENDIGEILEKDDLMLLCADSDTLDVTKDSEGEEQILLYSEFKDTQERLGGTCD